MLLSNSNRNGWTGYIVAVRSNNLDWVKEYIKQGGDLNYPIVPQGAIHCSVYSSNMEMLKVLLDAHINVNQQDEDGDTALHYAVGETKNIGCVELLLRYGASPFIKNYSCYEESPMDLALRLKQDKISELLKEYADLMKRLCKASEDGNVDLVEDLLTTTKVNINAISSEFVNPLHEASLSGHLPVVKCLIRLKADINAKTASESTRFNTPLHCAATKGHLDVVQYLLEQGAEKDMTNSNRHTPLLCAIIMERADVAICLIKNGCNVTVKDMVGKTPLHWASFYSLYGVISLLLEYGADTNVLDDYGQLPLYSHF